LLNNFRSPLQILAKIIYQYPIHRFIPSRLYLSIMYRSYTGLRLEVDNPKRFNEKMQWLKLNDHQDWYKNIADKVEVRKYVLPLIGEQYLIPLIAVYNSVDEIEWSKLPGRFVLKCTHDSGTTVVCTDKQKLNINEAKRFLRKRMSRSYYYVHREFSYKDITPRIVCEQFISADGESVPNDYKFFCFHGVPKLIQVDTERFVDHGRVLYYPDWTIAPFTIGDYSKENLTAEKPANLDEMLSICKKLSKDFKFIRVDLYSVNNKVYFGELTIYHGSGFEKIVPDEYDFWLGDMLDLN
jgi:hypothetical protein